MQGETFNDIITRAVIAEISDHLDLTAWQHEVLVHVVDRLRAAKNNVFAPCYEPSLSNQIRLFEDRAHRSMGGETRDWVFRALDNWISRIKVEQEAAGLWKLDINSEYGK